MDSIANIVFGKVDTASSGGSRQNVLERLGFDLKDLAFI
jgi:hypothetical protein